MKKRQSVSRVDARTPDVIERTPDVMKVRDVIKQIEADGWTFARTGKGHRIWTKDGNPLNMVINGHDRDEVKPGTLSGFRRITGLKFQ